MDWRLMFLPLSQHSVRRGSRLGTRTIGTRMLSPHGLTHPVENPSAPYLHATVARLRQGQILGETEGGNGCARLKSE